MLPRNNSTWQQRASNKGWSPQANLSRPCDAEGKVPSLAPHTHASQELSRLALKICSQAPSATTTVRKLPRGMEHGQERYHSLHSTFTPKCCADAVQKREKPHVNGFKQPQRSTGRMDRRQQNCCIAVTEVISDYCFPIYAVAVHHDTPPRQTRHYSIARRSGQRAQKRGFQDGASVHTSARRRNSHTQLNTADVGHVLGRLSSIC